MTELEIRDYFTDEMFSWLRAVIGPGRIVDRYIATKPFNWENCVWEFELGKAYNILKFKNDADSLVYRLRWQ